MITLVQSQCTEAGLEMIKVRGNVMTFTYGLFASKKTPIKRTVGILSRCVNAIVGHGGHCTASLCFGPVKAFVVGKNKWHYDVFGAPVDRCRSMIGLREGVDCLLIDKQSLRRLQIRDRHLSSITNSDSNSSLEESNLVADETDIEGIQFVGKARAISVIIDDHDEIVHAITEK
eukprot:TRINITY_DN13192_c0_g1_i1.p1 TRINITY_DN13192_c0_g1~~TRINITY_DN13192_c0_g1_i1.p1  ORF type:complete len:174 (+),score=52.62 TRINITY_DN13192_c0_g1_i1:25-546(+)